MAEVRGRERRHQRAERERDERGPAEAGPQAFRDATDEEDAGKEGDPTRQYAHAPEPEAVARPVLHRAVEQRFRRGQLEQGEPGRLVREEMPAVAGLVERTGQAAVVVQVPVYECTRQAEP